MKYTEHGSDAGCAAGAKAARLQGNPARPPGIEGDEMRKVYYSRMRSYSFTGVLMLLVGGTGIVLGGATSAQEGMKGAAVESHEGLTVSATPWRDTAKYKEKFPKKSPYTAGVVAVQVAFRNDSDDSIKVNLSRIRLTVHLDSENTQELPSLSAEEVAQAVLKPGAKDPTKRSRIPLPVSVPKNNDKNFTELQRQAQDASVPSGVVAPHSTVQGLLYFDLQNQFDLLDTAHLYVPELAFMKGNRALTFFDIDLGQRGTP